MPQIKTIIVIAALAMSFAGGYWLADNGWEKKITKERADTSAYIARLSEQHREKERELSKNAEALDRKYTESLSTAERRINELSDAIAAGPKRVFVRATCPASSVLATGTTSGVGDAGAAELGGAAREDYLRLRREISRQEAQIRYLQEYVKSQLSRSE